MIRPCPFCQSQLAVSEQQLSVANGMVRCGNCMQLFSAHNDVTSVESTSGNGSQGNNATVSKAHIRDQFGGLANRNSSTQAEHSQRLQNHSSRVLDDGRVEPVLLAAAHTADALLTEIDAQQKGWLAVFRAAVKAALQILTFILCFVFAALLALQWLKPAAEKIPPWQPLQQGYALVCRHLQCSLSISVQDYRVSKLQIHNQHAVKNSLLVSAEITNRSDRALPHPLLLLRFSTLQRNEQASRLFEPANYIPNFNRDEATLLAAKSALNIKLSIADPGAEFTNYEIEVIPPI